MRLDHVLPAATVVAATTALVALGPAATGLIRYRVSANAIAQLVGCELVTLVAAFVLGWATVWGQSARAHLLGAGAACYLVYQMVTLVVGQEYHRYDGNGEHFFPLYVLVTLSALWCLANVAPRCCEGRSRSPPGWRPA